MEKDKIKKNSVGFYLKQDGGVCQQVFRKTGILIRS